MVLGDSAADAHQTAEWIDLSVAAPTWQALPNLNMARDKVNSVLLQDGHVMIAGGIETLPDGGPVEIFDPEESIERHDGFEGNRRKISIDWV
jgi:hypothetical protein